MAKILLLTLFKPLRNYQILPPLGIMYLASSLRNSGHQVRLLDLRGKREHVDRRLGEIADFGPDLVGFSCLIMEHGELVSAASLVKKAVPNALAAVGGPIVKSVPESVMEIPEVDFAVAGEGETVLLSVASAIDEGRSLDSVPGLTLRDGDGIRTTGAVEPIADLDILPFPAWDLVDLDDYHSAPRHGYLYVHQRYMSMITSRGCPYSCIFCHEVMGKRFRKRSPENIVEEMQVLKQEYGIREITVSDDAFNLDSRRAEQVCDLILERNLDFRFTFPSGLRGDIMTSSLLRKLKRAGTYKVAYGIETGSPRMQKVLKKNVDLVRLREVIRETARLGILVQGFFMLGFPTESREELEATVRYATSSRLHLASFNIANAFPGTEMFQMAMDMGLPVERDLGDYDYDSMKVQLSELTLDELRRMVRKVNVLFYLNPVRLVRMLWLLPRKRQLLGLVRYFFDKNFRWIRD